MESYIPRYIDGWLKDLMPHLPAIAIEGAKGVGKTQTAQRLAKTTFKLDQKNQREIIGAEFERLYNSPTPIFIDEWQYLPEVWDRVRRMVDDGIHKDCILLAGSQQSRDLSLHSGAGRIVRVRMRPLSIAERFENLNQISLKDCFAGQITDIHKYVSELTLTDYVKEIFKTGFPGIFNAEESVRPRLINSYIENIATREFAAQGIRLRQPQVLIRWMRSYAAAVGTTASYTKILDAATSGEDDKPSKRSTVAYREALESLWITDDLHLWLEGEDFFGRLKQTPKHFLVDPGVEAHLLRLSEERLLHGLESTVHDVDYGSIAGRLFESLCAMSVRTYASAIDAQVYYLRTASGSREIDLIVEKGRDLVVIETKVGATVSDEEVRHLNWFEEKVGDRVKAKIVLTTGDKAYRRNDGVLVVPAVLLGA